MFQSFEAPTELESSMDRINRLRSLLPELRVDAVLVPRADEHQGEYVPASAERLKWLTGFSGSAGIAVITRRAGALFVDGRYTVQARSQVSKDAGDPSGSRSAPVRLASSEAEARSSGRISTRASIP